MQDGSHMDVETSTTASWTDVHPGAGVQYGGVAAPERPLLVLNVEDTVLDGVPLEALFGLVQAKLSKPRTNGPPTPAEVIGTERIFACCV